MKRDGPDDRSDGCEKAAGGAKAPDGFGPSSKDHRASGVPGHGNVTTAGYWNDGLTIQPQTTGMEEIEVHLSRKGLWIVLAVVAIVLAGSLGAGAAAKKTTLTLWFHYEKGITDTMIQMVEDYERLHPEIDIVIDTAPHAQHDQKLQIAYAGGIGPDLFDVSTRLLPQFMKVKGLDGVDVAAFGVKDEKELRNQFAPGALDGYIFDGKLRAIPVGVSPYSWAINATHFREAGLDPVTGYPKTWEALIEVSKKLVRTDSRGVMVRQPLAYPFGMASAWYMLGFEALMWQLGSATLSSDESEATINSPAGVKTLQLWQDMIYKHKIISLERVKEDYIGEFAKGTISMFWAGPWSIGAWKTTNPDVMKHAMVVPFPHFAEGKRAAAVTSWGMVVNAYSPPEKRKEAWKFIAYMASRAEDWIERTGWLVPTRGLLTSKAAASFPYFNIFMDDQAHGRPLLVTLNFAEIADSAVRAIERTLLNKVPAQESLNTAKKEIDAIQRRK